MATLGEYRVGVDFNPSGDVRVANIKHAAAMLIDFLAAQRTNDHEVDRLLELAMDEIESAAMWGVKAVTKRSRNG